MPRRSSAAGGLRAVTLLSAGFSRDPPSRSPIAQLFLFLLVPVVYDFARARADTMLSIITVGAASAFIGVVQYGLLNYDNLGRRMQGTLSHWMTYSGTLMLVICASLARLLFGSRDRLWAAFVLPALLVSLTLTLTRGAWLGAAAGAAVLLLIKDVRLTLLVPVGRPSSGRGAGRTLEPRELAREHERSDHAGPRGHARGWRGHHPGSPLDWRRARHDRQGLP
jgi:hypothetical protein